MVASEVNVLSYSDTSMVEFCFNYEHFVINFPTKCSKFQKALYQCSIKKLCLIEDRYFVPSRPYFIVIPICILNFEKAS